MDKIIENYDSIPFGELNLCLKEGLAYQREGYVRDYSDDYYQHYVELEGKPIGTKLNEFRAKIARKYCKKVIDIGIGSGEFLKCLNCDDLGFDVNPVGIDWLKKNSIFVDPYESIPDDIEGLTFWDSLEHIPEPSVLLSHIRKGMYAIVSLPVFSDLLLIRQSKHYRPNEHLYYFTCTGLIRYMNDNSFDVVELSDQETLAGRENILTFVFQKI